MRGTGTWRGHGDTTAWGQSCSVLSHSVHRSSPTAMARGTCAPQAGSMSPTAAHVAPAAARNSRVWWGNGLTLAPVGPAELEMGSPAREWAEHPGLQWESPQHQSQTHWVSLVPNL